MIAVVRFLGFDVLAPERIAWACGALAVLLVGLWSLRRRRIERERLVAERLVPRVVPGFSRGRARARVVLAAAAALFAALAAVGPVRGYTLRDVERKGIDLVVCLDTSRSMLVQDVKPDRLTRAKRELAGLFDRMKGDRAALLAFAGDVREVAPLTHDRETLKSFLETLTPADNLRGGTDLGTALEKALEMFDGRTGAHEAIVLVTDGEDLGARGYEVAQKAKERGIRVYVLGMGTSGGGKIPDGTQGFVRGSDTKEVVSRMDPESLARIASAAGGDFATIEMSPIPLEELYEKRIAQLEGRELEGGQERIPHDRYQWPLVVAAACMLFEFGLRERRSVRAGGVA
ncbi:MAG: VWA domain-containing protein [Planctomycetota bacterium]|nr:VWA domain-containing protein [Planctomycetota bacterium]